jgi:hypothetical protein
VELSDLIALISGFHTWSHVDKIKLFVWHLDTHRDHARVQTAQVLQCYDALHLERPANLSAQLSQLNSKKPKELLKDSKGYYLEKRVKDALDKTYGQRQVTVQVHELLTSLSGKVSSEAERLFLAEALSCFKIKAFRAAIIMAWNLAFDHLQEWIIINHLAAFNARIPVRYPRRTGVNVTKKEDFADNLKESEIIEICSSASLISGNIKKILDEKLTRRNMAAHPSTVEITQLQAEDVITDLVNNIVLKLT